MKLARVHVTEFQSVRDSGTFEIGDITCLVGKNESGKTAILQALYRLHPYIESHGRYSVTDDYPRWDVEDYRLAVEAQRRAPARVARAEFALEADDRQAVEAVAGPGALPDVTPVATGRYRWLAERLDLQVPTDLDAALAHIDDYGPDHVVQLSVSGQTDLSGRRRLEDALARASGKARCLTADLDALRLEPTDADLAGLAADGYLGDVIGELGAQLRDHPDGPAHDALALLADFLADERGGAR